MALAATLNTSFNTIFGGDQVMVLAGVGTFPRGLTGSRKPSTLLFDTEARGRESGVGGVAYD